MGRLTDNDQYFGPIVYGKSGWTNYSLVWSSKGDEWDDPAGGKNTITVNFGQWMAQIKIPNILKPVEIHNGSYSTKYCREYGFRITDDGFVSLYLGASTHDSDTDQSWHCFLPWTQWRHVRHSLYNADGSLFVYNTDTFKNSYELKQLCSKVQFEFDDYDGKRIIATTMIEEREWLRGTKWCKWLSWFYKPKKRVSLDLTFSEEVGPCKGSYKGGTIGHSIDMLPGEAHIDAFKRYCEIDHTSRGTSYKLKYIGQVTNDRK